MTLRKSFKTTLRGVSAAFALVTTALPTMVLADVKPGVMNMSQKDVNGQTQIIGNYGSAWTEAEIRSEAAASCKSVGLVLAKFSLGAQSSRDGQAFVGVCE